MGTECSCSQLQISKQHQIQHQSPTEAITSTKEKTNDQDHCKDEDKQLIQTQTLIDQAVKQGSNSIKFSCSLKEKTQRKKVKKVVQVILPGNQQENHDGVTFIQKQQNDKNEINLITKTLKNHFILSQLSVEEIHYVVQRLKYCQTKRGTYIFKQGDPSFSYYIILEGRCSVHIDGQFKKYLEQGSSFGDLGIVYNAPRSASILAQTDCTFAQLNSKTFKKVISDLNFMYEEQNKQVLEQIEFYQKLTDNQKNALASNCMTQTYQAGQIIFNKGDAANAFYIILQGIVTILQKNLDLKARQNVGVNAIIGKANGIRSNTLVAKTNCRLISLTRDIISKTLGDHLNNILRKNLIIKILKQSDIWEMYTQRQWNNACQKMQLSNFNKGDVILSKNSSIPPLTLAVILKADARSKMNPKASFYIANSIIEPNKVFKKQEYILEDSFVVESQAQLVKLQLPAKKDQWPEKSKMNKITVLTSSGSSNGSDKNKPRLKDFVIIRSLRAGNFGKVYACYNRVRKTKLAIKVMNKQSTIVSSALSYIEKQTEILSSLPDHPFIVKYYETIAYQNLIMIAMELIEGQDLFDSTNSKIPLRLDQIRFLIGQLILIVEYLHDNKIIYRDLKPENVMLNLDGYLTLVDFGTAKRLTIQKRFKTSTIIGTPHYMAPEILLGKGYSFTADWWSLGVMLCEMATGRLPYGESLEDPFSVYQEIIKSELVLGTNQLDVDLRVVLEKLLTKSPYKRMKNGSSELKNMNLFKNFDWEKLLRKEYEGLVFPSKSSYISTQEIEKALSKKKVNLALQIFLKGSQQKLIN